LRQQAEATARKEAAESPAGLKAISPEGPLRAIHELRVHQIELEMQNEELRRTQGELEASRARYIELYDLAPVGYLTVSEGGLILEANLAVARMLGLDRRALVKTPLSRFVFTDDQDLCYRHCMQVSDAGRPQACELRLLKGDGTAFWVHLATTTAPGPEGVPVSYTTISDITERKRAGEVLLSRLRLSDFARGHTLEELLTRTLDEAEQLTGSAAGFFHFVGADQETIMLQTWSTNTLRALCTAQGKGQHYPASRAGVWADALRQRRPVIHNDCASLPHRKGMPPGHPPVLRELVVPLLRNEQVVALLGVGNKPGEYGTADVESVSLLGNLAWDMVQTKLAEQALRKSEHQYRDVFELASDALLLLASDTGQVIDVNGMASVLYGYERDELLARKATDLSAEPEETGRRTHEAHLAPGQIFNIPLRLHRKKDGTVFPVEISARSLIREGQSLILVACRDITERKRAEAERATLENRLQQAQKMESVGRLAGGVAHEFNNKLMGIMNYVELCRDELPPEHPARGYLDEITSEANHSADITKQLLAFARKQVTVPRVLDLSNALAGMAKMLQVLIGEDIDLVWLPGMNLWPIKVDPGQLKQILVNFCLNARDAIAGVGRVTIETANVTLDNAYCAEHAEAVPGEYVRLAVSDSGCGMSKDVLTHVFEPFYTTKEVGKGTGLGLATVYGIVTQNHGHIEVQSEVGKGTTFSLYLPRAAADADLGPDAATPAELPRGTETILLAEDEKSVRLTSRLFLEALGYTVLAAETPEEALRLGGARSGPIHLLIADVIMPGMNGSDLAGLLTKECPNLKCLFMSGYTADVMRLRGSLSAGLPFMPKPFSRHDLARKVREVLDGD
jgi:PAS domain S-box-containing protein